MVRILRIRILHLSFHRWCTETSSFVPINLVLAVSAPGRLDGQQDQMPKGVMSPKENDPLTEKANSANYNLNRSRTLVTPSGCELYSCFRYNFENSSLSHLRIIPASS